MAEKKETPLNLAVDRLRKIAMAHDAGELIGNEDALVARLGVSRSTVRQAARLIEREGLLRVKRGPFGGYFAGRPDANTIETAIGTYLQTIEFDPEDVTLIASALWVELVRKAAARQDEEARSVTGDLGRRIVKIDAAATFASIRALEEESREAIVRLARSKYIELIFRSNIVFANRTFASPAEQDDTPEHRRFVPAWRDAKTIELSAIGRGDADVAVMAARHARALWHRRVWLNRAG